jgi:hypothetical protein
MIRKIPLVLSLLVLLSSLLLGGFIAMELVRGVSAQGFDATAEYSNGTIAGQLLDVWYAWVNISKTQIVYYALISEEVNPPIKNFLGQHFQIENETEVFVGNTLLLIEVYNDTNDDGIPQANFTSGESEIAYYLEVNSSVGYEITPIQKTLEEEISHFTWGLKYNTIDGFLQYANQGNTGARVIIDYLDFHYDFYEVQNVSYLKTSFDIGNITNIEPWWEEPPISLDTMSLSLLFSTVISASNPYTTYVNGEPYNSTIASELATMTAKSEVSVDLIRAYEFLFGDTYNLTRGDVIETHEIQAAAAATSSVPNGAKSRLDWILGRFEEHLNISNLFPLATGIGGQVDLNYNVSTLLYRICYPIWDGLPINHDPTNIAYLFSTEIIPEFLSLIILPLLMLVTSLVSLIYKKKSQV